MSKSRCPLCGKTLRGGEWMFRRAEDGTIIKACANTKICNDRQKKFKKG